MGIRTDLAMEAKALWEKSAGKTTKLAGVRARERERDGFAVTDVHILDRRGEAALGKPAGRYVTLELPPLARDVRPAAEALAAELRRLLRLQPGQGVLVAGLGNEAVTPDALGPLCLRGLFLTRHLIRHLPEQFGGVRPVSAVAPGVLATTGMESLELVRGAVRHVRPACVLAVDALAAAAPERLCRTFQLSDAGIVPRLRRRQRPRRPAEADARRAGVLPRRADGARCGHARRTPRHDRHPARYRRAGPLSRARCGGRCQPRAAPGNFL